MHAMKALHPILPFFRNRQPVCAEYLITGTARIISANLKTGRKDDAVDRILDIVQHNAVFGDAFDALPIGIHQFDIRSIESG